MALPRLRQICLFALLLLLIIDFLPPAQSLPLATAASVEPNWTRYEETALTYAINGTPCASPGSCWTAYNAGVSSGLVRRDGTTNASATLALSSTTSLVVVGLVGYVNAGNAEIFIDNVSRGVMDTYRPDLETITLVYTMTPGLHTVEVRTLGTRSSFSNGNLIYIDYIDAWDGTALPPGTFEQNDARVLNGSNVNAWSQVNDAAASGGSYTIGNISSAWFPFTGTSVQVRLVTASNHGPTEILVDGVRVAVIDLFSFTTTFPVYAFGPFTNTAHILEIRQYRGYVGIDSITTPATEPFYTPPARTGVVRYEEDDPALRYNGAAFPQRPNTWFAPAQSFASSQYAARSFTAGDTVSITTTNTWVTVGFVTGASNGIAQVYVDGVLTDTVDTYTPSANTLMRLYDLRSLSPGAHTVSVVASGQRNPFSSNPFVAFDYFDVWDGTSMPTGTFEELDPRIVRSSNQFAPFADPQASAGQLRWAAESNWFPFTGTSVAVRVQTHPSGGPTEFLIDGVLQGRIDLFSFTAEYRTISFGNLTDGPHVLELRNYRGRLYLDAITTPGMPPFYTPPLRTGIVRYEEDDPALRYNGAAFPQRPSNWVAATSTEASRNYVVYNLTAGQTIGMTFTGTWAALGLVTNSDNGLAQVLIDGQPREVVDGYSADPGTLTRIYDNLGPGTHTISLTVLGQKNPFSSNTYIEFDYFDVWDGTSMPTGQFEEADPRIIRSENTAPFAFPLAGDGQLRWLNGNGWFPFTGTSVGVRVLASSVAGPTEFWIDGVLQDRINFFSFTDQIRTISFGNLANGPHVLELRNYRGRIYLDRIETPGTPPFYTPPTRSGIIRYEEDDPALRYNGVLFPQRPSSWNSQSYGGASNQYVAYNRTAGNSVSLTFSYQVAINRAISRHPE